MGQEDYINELDKAIQLGRKAVQESCDVCRGERLELLGNNLGRRYHSTRATSDLEEAVQLKRQAVIITSVDHPDRARTLMNFGLQLGDLYYRTGAIASLNEAIELGREAVKITPADHGNRAGRLNSLGLRLWDRYQRTNALADLNEAIQLSREAIKHTPRGHENRAGRLDSLAPQLGDRFLRTEAADDLDEAILLGREAIQITPHGHVERIGRLNSLGNRLKDRFWSTGALSDIDEAIRLGQEVIDTHPEGHVDQAVWLYTFSLRLGCRYSKTRTIDDLENSINFARKAIGSTPEDHPDRARRFHHLASRLGNRYDVTQEIGDLKECILCFQTALCQSNSPPIVRIFAGKDVTPYHLLPPISREASNEACRDLSNAVDLIPRLSPRSLGNSDKQHTLSLVAGVASDATAVALLAGNSPYFALSLLERGRHLLAASLEDVRDDIEDLRSRHPDLANQFIELRDELAGGGLRGDLSDRTAKASPFEDRARRYNAGNKLEELLVDIRKLPTFEGFLSLPSEMETRDAATHGPIVVINVSRYRCDAIIVEKHEIRSLLLPVTYREIEEKTQRKNLGTPAVLAWLWNAVAKPVLDALNFKRPLSNGNWPHVWWIPTGILSQFPIHAAGHHSDGSTETVLDRVVSSYSSSVKAVVHCRRRRGLRGRPRGSGQALLVAMEDTPGSSWAPLDFATDEIDMVRELCPSLGLKAVEPPRHKLEVLGYLGDPALDIFHFAGHGYTDKRDPSCSKLVLEDWETDGLTVGSLLDLNLREHAPFLAYLSACGTGQITDAKFLDESIHIISACQLAGFSHVIGTLWDVNDEACLDIARIVYETICDADMTDESVAFGLHRAMQAQRKSWLEDISQARQNRSHRKGTDQDSSSEDEEKKTFALWIPYVHFGI